MQCSTMFPVVEPLIKLLLVLKEAKLH